MRKLIQFGYLSLLSGLSGYCGSLDIVGVTLLRQIDPTLTGSGVRVAQTEAPESSATPPPFEVNPGSVGQPTSLFTYYSSSGTANTFPNLAGQGSGHANGVAFNFFSVTGGVAPGLIHLDNYEANYFYQNVITAVLPTAIPGQIVNQSFIFGSTPPQTVLDEQYDNYAVQTKVLFVSAVGNGGGVNPPGTSYNGIGVGVVDGSSSMGPTPDNGRCKPDLCAPGGATSFSTPYVSGSATLLLQAGLRGDGGTGRNVLAKCIRDEHRGSQQTGVLRARVFAGLSRFVGD